MNTYQGNLTVTILPHVISASSTISVPVPFSITLTDAFHDYSTTFCMQDPISLITSTCTLYDLQIDVVESKFILNVTFFHCMKCFFNIKIIMSHAMSNACRRRCIASNCVLSTAILRHFLIPVWPTGSNIIFVRLILIKL